jgi:hypothetical protein
VHNLSDRGGGNLSEVAGRGGTRLAGGGGLDGVRPKGRRKKVMDRLERVLGVTRSSGIRLANWRRAGCSYLRWLGNG